MADELAKDIPFPRDYFALTGCLAQHIVLNNELTLAEENLSKALNLVGKSIWLKMKPISCLTLPIALRSGETRRSQNPAEEALLITERSGYVLQGADVHLFLAQFALEQEKDKVKAKELAEKAKELAYCDGPPYYYKVAYEEAERLLEELS